MHSKSTYAAFDGEDTTQQHGDVGGGDATNRCKIVTVGADWCGYTKMQVANLEEHCKNNDAVMYDYIKHDAITDSEVSKSLRAFPTSFCCKVDQDSVECAIANQKKNKGYAGMRSAQDLEKICMSDLYSDE